MGPPTPQSERWVTPQHPPPRAASSALYKEGTSAERREPGVGARAGGLEDGARELHGQAVVTGRLREEGGSRVSSSAGSSAWGQGHYDVQPPGPQRAPALSSTGMASAGEGRWGAGSEGRSRVTAECASPLGAADPVRRLGRESPPSAVAWERRKQEDRRPSFLLWLRSSWAAVRAAVSEASPWQACLTPPVCVSRSHHHT